MTLDKLYEQIKSWRESMLSEGMTATAYEMKQALKSIESDMRLSEAKKSGNASIVKAANRIIKNAESGSRDMLKGMFTNNLCGETVYCVCDGVLYDCVTDCATAYGITAYTMMSWLRGDRPMRKDFVEKGLAYV